MEMTIKLEKPDSKTSAVARDLDNITFMDHSIEVPRKTTGEISDVLKDTEHECDIDHWKYKKNRKTQSSTCGHVFILHCDVDGLAADVILRTKYSTHIEANFSVNDCESDLKNPKTRVFESFIRRNEENESHHLKNTVQMINSFFEKARKCVSHSEYQRSKPLFGLSIFGDKSSTNDCCSVFSEGEIIDVIVPMMYNYANEFKADIALCTLSQTIFNVMQVKRWTRCPFIKGPFWMLSTELKNKAQKLADLALTDSLSIFFGAGISFCSGLPSWNSLLRQLAKKAEFSVDDQHSLLELNYLDQATIIEEKMGAENIRLAVKDLISVTGRFTPVHAILSELGLRCATTNYDELFENAARTSEGKVMARLPWDSRKLSESDNYDRKYITKLHGCVSHPHSIVLTRKDYMRYRENREALRGIVHDMLLTSHIVFIGFSMTDDNLHIIIDDARKCLDGNFIGEGSAKGAFGTILSMTENKMFSNLWKQDFNVTSFGKSWNESPAWIHDAFVDCVGSIVTREKSHLSFVLDPRFENLLTSTELTFKKCLSPLEHFLKTETVKESPAWSSIEKILKKMGANV